MKHKTFAGGIKSASDEGQVVAEFARLNVKDHDGDVTVPGAFKEGAPVRVSAYNHGSWGGQLPIGKGTISSDQNVATADLQFFLQTTAGRDTFEVVKQLGDLMEWSYGYDVLEGGPGKHDGEDVNFLKALEVHEVSPVLLGAGIGTRTVSAKSLKALSDEEVAEEAIRVFTALKERGLSVPDELAEYVRLADASSAELKRAQEDLMTIGILGGYINLDDEGE